LFVAAVTTYLRLLFDNDKLLLKYRHKRTADM